MKFLYLIIGIQQILAFKQKIREFNLNLKK